VRRWVGRVVAGAVGVAGLGAVLAQPPAGKAPAVLPPVTTDGGRTVATIAGPRGTIAITQEEFGKFLTDRGGAEKLELYVNKRIIETAAAEKGVSVTRQEMEAALKKDMDGITVNYNDFVKIVLPKYGKTLYEFMEDIIRPRLLLEKLSAGEVVVTDDDLKIQFERVYGEKRQVQMVLYPLADEKNAMKLYAEARKSQDDFDSVARSQPNPSLAATKGHVQPISRHLPAEDKSVEEVAFKLKEGEVSEVIKTAQGFVFIKLIKILPPSKDVTFEGEKNRLMEAARDEKMRQYVPKKFAQLREKAMPNVVYTAPKEWQTISPGAPSPLTAPIPAVQQAGGK
jgi:parvulin-like peptidyl-prolyl isomerase